MRLGALPGSRLLVAGVLAAVALPASASAATVTDSGSTISYVADPGEPNNVAISLAGDSYTLTEQGAGVVVKDGGGCVVATQGSTTTATCPAAGINLLDVQAGDQNDTVRILAATASRISGGDGDDTLSGGPGVDILRGGAGADLMSGGASSDVVDYSDRANPLTITLDGQPGDGEPGENDNVAPDIEIVNGGSGDDHISGSGADNVLNGNGGNDTLNGGAGDDALNRGDFDGGLDAEAGSDSIRGGPGNDSVSYSDATAPVRVTLDGRPGDGAPGENDNVAADVEAVGGGLGNDVLIGNSRDNILQGGPGDDRLVGGGGADTLDGGRGDDDIQALDKVADQILCEGGSDGVIADRSDVLTACERVERTVVRVLVGKAKMRRGAVRIAVRCSSLTTDGCSGSLTLKLGRTTLGSKGLRRRPGARAVVKIRLSKKAQRVVRKRHKLTAVGTFAIKDPSGYVVRTTQKVKLIA